MKQSETYADVETSSAAYAARFSGAAGRFLLGEQERLIRRLLEPYAGGTVLDVGGGHGQLLDLYSAMDMKVTLHGSDPVCFQRLDDDALGRVQQLVSPPQALPLASASVDVVVSVRLLSHTGQWRKLIRELCRVARHAVILDYPSTRSLNALTPYLFGLKKKLEGNTRTYTSFDRRIIAREFASAGFGEIAEVPQFFLPMVVHRIGTISTPMRWAETIFRGIGLTGRLGSPVIIRASRSRA